MINLLPNSINASVTYARRNRTLVRWIVACSIGLAGIIVIIMAGLFYINYQVRAYSRQVDDTKTQLAAQDLEATQTRITEISNSVKLANQVLGRGILFSKLLQGIGSVIPPGSALQNLNITNDFEGGIDLQFVAADYQTATQVQVNLTDERNKVFEKADIQSISCASSSSDSDEFDAAYPCQINIRALFAKDSPYTLTGSKESAR